MPANPENTKTVTVYVPLNIWEEVKRFREANDQPDLSDTKTIVLILRKWYNDRMAEKAEWDHETERRKGDRRASGG